MENIIKFLPLLLSLMSQGGQVAKIVELITQALGLVQGILPPVPAGTPDVSKMTGIQEALKKLGFDPGPIDGNLGDRTKAAVKAFQSMHPELKADGWPGSKTQAALAIDIGKLVA